MSARATNISNGGGIMPKYLTHVSFTAEGVKGLQKGTAKQRRDAVTKLVESAGGKLEAFYFAFGKDDGVGIYDLPDNVTAAAISIASNAAGHVHMSMTPLVTVEEMDQAITKSGKFKIPG
jgi:uncharacterized protein with GYD domain